MCSPPEVTILCHWTILSIATNCDVKIEGRRTVWEEKRMYHLRLKFLSFKTITPLIKIFYQKSPKTKLRFFNSPSCDIKHFSRNIMVACCGFGKQWRFLIYFVSF